MDSSGTSITKAQHTSESQAPNESPNEFIKDLNAKCKPIMDLIMSHSLLKHFKTRSADTEFFIYGGVLRFIIGNCDLPFEDQKNALIEYFNIGGDIDIFTSDPQLLFKVTDYQKNPPEHCSLIDMVPAHMSTKETSLFNRKKKRLIDSFNWDNKTQIVSIDHNNTPYLRRDLSKKRFNKFHCKLISSMKIDEEEVEVSIDVSRCGLSNEANLLYDFDVNCFIYGSNIQTISLRPKLSNVLKENPIELISNIVENIKNKKYRVVGGIHLIPIHRYFKMFKRGFTVQENQYDALALVFLHYFNLSFKDLVTIPSSKQDGPNDDGAPELANESSELTNESSELANESSELANESSELANESSELVQIAERNYANFTNIQIITEFVRILLKQPQKLLHFIDSIGSNLPEKYLDSQPFLRKMFLMNILLSNVGLDALEPFIIKLRDTCLTTYDMLHLFLFYTRNGNFTDFERIDEMFSIRSEGYKLLELYNYRQAFTEAQLNYLYKRCGLPDISKMPSLFGFNYEMFMWLYKKLTLSEIKELNWVDVLDEAIQNNQLKLVKFVHETLNISLDNKTYFVSWDKYSYELFEYLFEHITDNNTIDTLIHKAINTYKFNPSLIDLVLRFRNTPIHVEWILDFFMKQSWDDEDNIESMEMIIDLLMMAGHRWLIQTYLDENYREVSGRLINRINHYHDKVPTSDKLTVASSSFYLMANKK